MIWLLIFYLLLQDETGWFFKKCHIYPIQFIGLFVTTFLILFCHDQGHPQTTNVGKGKEGTFVAFMRVPDEVTGVFASAKTGTIRVLCHGMVPAMPGAQETFLLQQKIDCVIFLLMPFPPIHGRNHPVPTGSVPS